LATWRTLALWSVVAGSGLLLPWLLQSVNLTYKGEKKHTSGLLISLLVLIGDYFLRKTIVEAGHTSSKDARTTLWHAKPRSK